MISRIAALIRPAPTGAEPRESEGDAVSQFVQGIGEDGEAQGPVASNNLDDREGPAQEDGDLDVAIGFIAVTMIPAHMPRKK